jgi:hypothetical protein
MIESHSIKTKSSFASILYQILAFFLPLIILQLHKRPRNSIHIAILSIFKGEWKAILEVIYYAL